MQFTADNQFPSNFGDFLSNKVNKINLSQFLAHKLLVLHGYDSSLKFVVTLNDTILRNIKNLLVQNDITVLLKKKTLDWNNMQSIKQPMTKKTLPSKLFISTSWFFHCGA